MPIYLSHVEGSQPASAVLARAVDENPVAVADALSSAADNALTETTDPGVAFFTVARPSTAAAHAVYNLVLLARTGAVHAARVAVQHSARLRKQAGLLRRWSCPCLMFVSV